MDNLIQQISDAVASQDWLSTSALGVVLLLTIVVTVLKVLKKEVPVLDKVLEVAKAGLSLLPKKQAPKPADEKGIAGIVPVKDDETLK